MSRRDDFLQGGDVAGEGMPPTLGASMPLTHAPALSPVASQLERSSGVIARPLHRAVSALQISASTTTRTLGVPNVNGLRKPAANRTGQRLASVIDRPRDGVGPGKGVAAQSRRLHPDPFGELGTIEVDDSRHQRLTIHRTAAKAANTPQTIQKMADAPMTASTAAVTAKTNS